MSSGISSAGMLGQRPTKTVARIGTAGELVSVFTGTSKLRVGQPDVGPGKVRCRPLSPGRCESHPGLESGGGGLVRDGPVLLSPELLHVGLGWRWGESLCAPQLHWGLVDVDLPVETPFLDVRCQLLL